MSTDQIIDDLTASTLGLDAATTDHLHARLAAAAEQAGILDVAYRTVDSPIGSLLLAATDEGLVRVAFDREDPELVLAELAQQVSPRILAAPGRLDPVARELDEYFGGTRQRFDVPVDLRLAHGFRRIVLDHLRSIAYGATESYATVAAASGNAAAVRAAASACSHNPVPLVVPCHRVIRSDGSIGQYRGGSAAKETLLALESTN